MESVNSGNRNFAIKLLQKHLKECQANEGYSIGLDNDDFFKWNVIFEGAEDTLYEGGYFKA